MRDEGLTWSDMGNAIEDFLGGDVYSETDLQLFGQAQRAEGVEIGIKIGLARASNGGGNGHFSLPKPSEMAEFCHDRLGQLKDDNQRQFIVEMLLTTRRGWSPKLGPLGYLASIYIKHGGRI